MKNYEKETLKNSLEAEQKEMKRLQAIYKKAAQDTSNKIRLHNGKISVLLSQFDELDEQQKSILQSQIYQKQFQENLKKQLDDILKDLQDKQYKSISEYLKGTYEDGFTSAMYSIHKQGIPIVTPIDQKQVVRAMTIDSKISKGLYSRLGEDVARLKQRITNNISRGVAAADSYANIARNIANGSKIGFNNAMRITRTEGNRIANQAKFDASAKAKEKGADVVKQWDSTLDGKTRPHHRQLDGQIRELEEPFEVAGLEAMHPSDFGRPEEDINCRCTMNQRARWALDDDELETLKERAKYFELDKTEDFNDFKKKYLKAAEKVTKETENALGVTVEAARIVDTKNFEELESYLKLSYDVDVDESVKQLDFAVVQETLTGVESVLAEFPEVADVLKIVKTDKAGIMSCTGEEITFNPSRFIKDGKLHDLCKEKSATHWWVDNASPASIGAHESAHAVEWLMILKNNSYKFDIQRYEAWSKCTEAKKIVSQACKNIKKTEYGKGKKNVTLISAISRYAQDSASETMAEAFADVYANGKGANPLSLEIKRLTLEIFKTFER